MAKDESVRADYVRPVKAVVSWISGCLLSAGCATSARAVAPDEAQARPSSQIEAEPAAAEHPEDDGDDASADAVETISFEDAERPTERIVGDPQRPTLPSMMDTVNLGGPSR